MCDRDVDSNARLSCVGFFLESRKRSMTAELSGGQRKKKLASSSDEPRWAIYRREMSVHSSSTGHSHVSEG